MIICLQTIEILQLFLLMGNNIITTMDPNFYKNLFKIDEISLKHAVYGGTIIAVASSLYYYMFGGILGISGMAGSLVKVPTKQTTRSKALVVIGMVFISAIVNKLYQIGAISSLPFDSTSFSLKSSVTHLILSGLLVGVGTELANGCTSGHGLCGMPRFSLRSYTAVLTFLSTAIVTSTLSLNKMIPEIPILSIKVLDDLKINLDVFIGVLGVLGLGLIIFDKSKSVLPKISLFLIGSMFGTGLMVAGMSQRTKIYGFLHLDKNWDPSLLFVLMTGVLINIFTFNFIKRNNGQPIYGDTIEDPRGNISFRLVFGAFLFGLGWGIGGLCPGPYLLAIPNSVKTAIYWGVPFFLSQKITNLIMTQRHGNNLKSNIKGKLN